LFGNDIQRTLSYLPTVQRYESLFCDVESSGAVDGGHNYPRARHRVGQSPAPAAVRRVPHNAGRAADEREGGEITERVEFGESRFEAVRPV
jgi:hypothetical protein